MSSSPQWDNRNRSFISPVRLQELGSPRQPVFTTNTPMDQSQRRPPLAQEQSHNRSSSFFSFRKSNDAAAPQRSHSFLSKSRMEQPQSPPTPQRSSFDAPAGAAPPPLHPEIRSVVQLTTAHARKIYFSG